MTLTGTDPATDIPGLGPRTAERLRGNIETVRDFVVESGPIVERLPSNKREASKAIRQAQIAPFNGWTAQEVQLAKFKTAHSANWFDPDGVKRTDLGNAVAAGPYPVWGLLGDRPWAQLPTEDELPEQPESLIPAHYRTPGDRHKAVYLVTTAETVTMPNEQIRAPDGDDVDTVVPARELELLADIVNQSPQELLETMRYAQDSPLHFEDPDTGLSALVPAATCPAREETAGQWGQVTREKADTVVYNLACE